MSNNQDKDLKGRFKPTGTPMTDAERLVSLADKFISAIDRIIQLEGRLHDAFGAAERMSGPFSIYKPHWAAEEPAVEDLVKLENPFHLIKGGRQQGSKALGLRHRDELYQHNPVEAISRDELYQHNPTIEDRPSDSAVDGDGVTGE